MKETEIQDWKSKIDKMSQLEMARLQRFAPAGHPVFNVNLPLSEYFYDRFRKLGGMTPTISKKIGWE